MTNIITSGAEADGDLSAHIVWDNHGCMPLREDDGFLPELDRYRDAGVNVVSINVGYGKMNCTEHLLVLSFMRRWITRHSDRYGLIATADDIPRFKAEGRLGITFDIEGMVPVEDHLHLVQTFYELGVRWMLIAYNRNNKAGGGCLDEDCGLTGAGRSIIDEMERVGMVLCLSHAGRRTIGEALEYCRNPPIFSHSNPFGDAQHPRNVLDEHMRACAAKGGVVGLSGIGRFLGTDRDPVSRLVKQLRYVIDLVGPEHVGLGLDFVFDVGELEAHVRAHPELYAPGTQTGAKRVTVPPEAMAEIAERLAAAGLCDDAIHGVMGDNWMRIARTVWR